MHCLVQTVAQVSVLRTQCKGCNTEGGNCRGPRVLKDEMKSDANPTASLRSGFEGNGRVSSMSTAQLMLLSCDTLIVNLRP